jgi:hypothetical protein
MSLFTVSGIEVSCKVLITTGCIFDAPCMNVYDFVSFGLHRNLRRIPELPCNNKQVKAAVSDTFIGGTYWFGFGQLCEDLAPHCHYDLEPLLHMTPVCSHSLVADEMLNASVQCGKFMTVMSRLCTPRSLIDQFCVLSRRNVTVAGPSLLYDQQVIICGELHASENGDNLRSISQEFERSCRKNTFINETTGLHHQSLRMISTSCCSSARGTSYLNESEDCSHSEDRSDAAAEVMPFIINATSQLRLKEGIMHNKDAYVIRRPSSGEVERHKSTERGCVSIEDMFSNRSEENFAFECACGNISADLIEAPMTEVNRQHMRDFMLFDKPLAMSFDTQSSSVDKLLQNASKLTASDVRFVSCYRRTTWKSGFEVSPVCNNCSVSATICSVETSVNDNLIAINESSCKDVYASTDLNGGDELCSEAVDVLIPFASDIPGLLSSTPVEHEVSVQYMLNV